MSDAEELGEVFDEPVREVRWVPPVATGGRLAALLVLAFAFLAFVVQMFPIHGSTAELVHDLRAGKTSTVYVEVENSSVYARWEISPLINKALTYTPADQFPGYEGILGAYEKKIRQEVGSSERVTFKDQDSALGMGGLSLFVMASYPFFLKIVWLLWLSLCLGVLLLSLMTIRGFRGTSSSAAWWPWVALFTGFGFFAYLWMEPVPLHRAFQRGQNPIDLTVKAVAAATLIAMSVLLVAGFSLHIALEL